MSQREINIWDDPDLWSLSLVNLGRWVKLMSVIYKYHGVLHVPASSDVSQQLQTLLRVDSHEKLIRVIDNLPYLSVSEIPVDGSFTVSLTPLMTLGSSQKHV